MPTVGTPTTCTPASSVHEVRTLLGLLRDALEGFPDLDLSLRDRRLTEQA